jgi:hypothetical protein
MLNKLSITFMKGTMKVVDHVIESLVCQKIIQMPTCLWNLKMSNARYWMNQWFGGEIIQIDILIWKKWFNNFWTYLGIYILINHLAPLYTMVKDHNHGNVEGIQNTSKGCRLKFRNHLFVGRVCKVYCKVNKDFVDVLKHGSILWLILISYGNL